MKIQTKITLNIVLTVSILLLVIYVNLNRNLKEHSYSRIYDTLEKNVLLVQSYLENTYPGQTKLKNADQFADQVGKLLGLRVTIIDLGGKVLGDSELDAQELATVENHLYRPEVQEALSTGFGQSRRFSTTVQKDMLYMARQINEEDTKGIIRLSIPLLDIKETSQNLKNIMVLSLWIAFLIAIPIGFFISLYISKPIEQISSVARAIAHGDYTRRMGRLPKDEIGKLGDSINYMTEQIRSRIEEIESNESQFEAVLLSMFGGLMVIDGKGKILLMNSGLKKFLRVEEDPVGKRPLEVIRNIEVQEFVEKVSQIDSGVESKEITILMPEEKILQLHATPVIRDETPDGAVFVFHDITELRRLENIRRDFVANVSHELRTPITNIKGYSETLLEGAIDDKQNLEEFLNIISTDATRLAQLVDDLLELSRIESGKVQLSYQEVDLSELFNRIIVGFKRHAKKSKVKVNIDIPKRFPKIKADQNGLLQVFTNLIENAIKYNKEGGSVNVVAEDKEHSIVIKLEDTGVGIPEDDLPRIFERFYRVDKARSRELGGTGLGLAIAKHIIQSHRGNISVHSQFGEGTSFTITLPKT